MPDCSDCNAKAKPVFMPLITFRMYSRLKNTIAESMEPKGVKKDELTKTPLRAVRKQPKRIKPWQAGSFK